MTEKRQSEKKPWEPTIEKMPTLNPFANDQNPADEPETDLDELEEGAEDDMETGKRK
jgi:hypothetical protein